MAARPYTHTFVRSYTAGAYVRWTCPPGKRGVLTCIIATGNGAAAGQVSGWIDGIPCARIQIQAALEAKVYMVRAVIYGGQELLTYIGTDGIASQWSGYLFDDLTGAKGPEGDVETLWRHQVEELPHWRF